MSKEVSLQRKIASVGKIVIVSSPSGGGKTSICRKLLSPNRKKAGWKFSVSYTTRKQRAHELDGIHYYFVTDAKFDELRKRDYFAENFRVHLYRYGTPRKPLEAALKAGDVMLLDVDVQGAKKLRKEYPQAITIFVLPPSVKKLRSRLKRRGTETKEQLQVRFENAKREMGEWKSFEYAVINDDLNLAVAQVLHIIETHPLRTQNLPAEQIRKITGS